MADRQECRVYGVACFREVHEDGRLDYFITRPNGKLRTVGEREIEARRMIDKAINRSDVGPQADEAQVRVAYERSYSGSNLTALSWSAFLGGWRACERSGAAGVSSPQPVVAKEEQGGEGKTK